MPKVSICVPAYGNSAGIRRLLGSVKEQTYTDYEVILTDDSPDDSVKKAALESDLKNISYHKNEKRLGATANWNAAVHLAKGEYIKIMHHDDWFSQADSLARFVAMLEENPEADLAFCGTWQVTLAADSDSADGAAGDRFARHITEEHRDMIAADWRNLFFGGYIGAPSATIYRNVGIDYEEQLKWLVDVEFYMRLLQRNPVFVDTDDPLICIGISESQLTESCREDGELNIFEYGFLYREFSLDYSPAYRRKFIDIALEYKMPCGSLKPYGIPAGEYYKAALKKGCKDFVFLAGVAKRKLTALLRRK